MKALSQKDILQKIFLHGFYPEKIGKEVRGKVWFYLFMSQIAATMINTPDA
ncbi:hypothetical protein CHISP_2774 [Chitinispirillum alkaliphilum]|nr:hypothetical protein CHISP_2774 [Chitinispirillum alkaliphilum]